MARLAPSRDIEDGGGLCCKVTLDVRAVHHRHRGRHEDGQVFADQVFALVAEHLVHVAVGDADQACSVNHNHRVDALVDARPARHAASRRAAPLRQRALRCGLHLVSLCDDFARSPRIVAQLRHKGAVGTHQLHVARVLSQRHSVAAISLFLCRLHVPEGGGQASEGDPLGGELPPEATVGAQRRAMQPRDRCHGLLELDVPLQVHHRLVARAAGALDAVALGQRLQHYDGIALCHRGGLALCSLRAPHSKVSAVRGDALAVAEGGAQHLQHGAVWEDPLAHQEDGVHGQQCGWRRRLQRAVAVRNVRRDAVHLVDVGKLHLHARRQRGGRQRRVGRPPSRCFLEKPLRLEAVAAPEHPGAGSQDAAEDRAADEQHARVHHDVATCMVRTEHERKRAEKRGTREAGAQAAGAWLEGVAVPERVHSQLEGDENVDERQQLHLAPRNKRVVAQRKERAQHHRAQSPSRVRPGQRLRRARERAHAADGKGAAERDPQRHKHQGECSRDDVPGRQAELLREPHQVVECLAGCLKAPVAGERHHKDGEHAQAEDVEKRGA